MKMIQFKCEFCKQDFDVSAVLGMYWNSRDAIEFCNPHDCNKHICMACFDAMPKVRPGRYETVEPITEPVQNS